MKAVINVNVDKKVKEEAIQVLNNLNLTLTEAIELYLKEIIKYNGIPFKIKL